jgi:hypothetical protein
VAPEHSEKTSITRRHSSRGPSSLTAQKLIQLSLERTERNCKRPDEKWRQAELILRGSDVKGPNAALDVMDDLGGGIAKEAEIGEDALAGPEEVKLRSQVLRLVG